MLYPTKRKKSITVCCICCIFLSLGILDINRYLYIAPEPTHISQFCYPGLIGLEGVVCENPNRTPDKTDLIIDAVRIVQNGLGVPVHGKVLIAVNAVQDTPRLGDFIRVKIRLKRPQNFNNPGGFDYEKYLRLKGILVRGYVDNPSKLVVIRGNLGNALSLSLEGFRDQLRTMIKIYSPIDQAPILQAMVLGEQNEIPKDTLAKFNRTGTTHILAISGFNLGIVFIISMLLFQTLLKSSAYILLRYDALKIAALLTIVPVVFYTFIAGLGMSVLRAALMIMALIVAVVFGKERDLPNTLALAALVMLFFYPPALFDVSFQLSFISVATILFIVPRFSRFLLSRRDEQPLVIPGWFRKSLRIFLLFLVVTMAATLGTIPLTTYYFNTFSLIVLAGNILLIPIMGYAVIILSMAIILAAPVSTWVAASLIKIASYLIEISVKIADVLASLPYASLYVATPSLIELTAYYILLAAVVLALDFYLNRSNIRKTHSAIYLKWCSAVVALMILFFVVDGVYIWVEGKHKDRLSVTYIDVGQGNAALVRLPGGPKMLIDGGGFFDDQFDIGKNVVAPCLWREKISRVDTLVLTHPHPDHLNGLLFIAENFSVREVWTNGSETTDEPFVKFKQIIKEKGIIHRQLGYPSVITLGPVILSILNPEKRIGKNAELDSDRLLNDQSLVLHLKYQDISFLFPGDISTGIEEKILKRNIRAQVLLAPHHGSRSSGSFPFLKKVRPEIVVFSCGKDNIFRFPNADVVKDCLKIGATVFRTDLDGAVTIETDGKRITRKSTFKLSNAQDGFYAMK